MFYCSTSLPSGNLVDGLPLAFSTGVVEFAGWLLALPHRHFDKFLWVVCKISLIKIETEMLMAFSKKNDVEKCICCSIMNSVSIIKFGSRVFVICAKMRKMLVVAFNVFKCKKQLLWGHLKIVSLKINVCKVKFAHKTVYVFFPDLGLSWAKNCKKSKSF